MYADFFGFRELPFNNTPDPRFFYSTPDHDEALASLIYAVQERKGFVLLTGEVGAGKTLVSRMMMRHFGSNIAFANINHAVQGSLDLMESICAEFELDAQQPGSHAQHVRILQDFLLGQFANDTPVVLVIDEAQNLSIDAFEQLRMIGNLEADDAKLLQIVIVGQPELQDKFSSRELRQLRQRVFRSFHLPSLSTEGAAGYIKHRLEVAGGKPEEVFHPQAIRRIIRASHGIPRMINAICDNALLSAYSADQAQVSLEIVESVIDRSFMIQDQRQSTTESKGAAVDASEAAVAHEPPPSFLHKSGAAIPPAAAVAQSPRMPQVPTAGSAYAIPPYMIPGQPTGFAHPAYAYAGYGSVPPVSPVLVPDYATSLAPSSQVNDKSDHETTETRESTLRPESDVKNDKGGAQTQGKSAYEKESTSSRLSDNDKRRRESEAQTRREESVRQRLQKDIIALQQRRMAWLSSFDQELSHRVQHVRNQFEALEQSTSATPSLLAEARMATSTLQPLVEKAKRVSDLSERLVDKMESSRNEGDRWRQDVHGVLSEVRQTLKEFRELVSEMGRAEKTAHQTLERLQSQTRQSQRLADAFVKSVTKGMYRAAGSQTLKDVGLLSSIEGSAEQLSENQKNLEQIRQIVRGDEDGSSSATQAKSDSGLTGDDNATERLEQGIHQLMELTGDSR
ncbi:MAG: AAA family ATPase [Phycisphaerae bacterium]